MKKQSKTARRPFTTAGERLDDVLGDTTKRIEEETQKLIAYINDELVPAIRDHSSNGAAHCQREDEAGRGHDGSRARGGRSAEHRRESPG